VRDRERKVRDRERKVRDRERKVRDRERKVRARSVTFGFFLLSCRKQCFTESAALEKTVLSVFL
jgi:hypothetical protein